MRPPPLLAVAVAVAVAACVAAPARGCYTSIFSFGDSFADTGNALRCGVMRKDVGRLPYGMTYFGRPTGRHSDGRLVVDFIAQAMGLPLLRPYLAGGSAEDFRRGANFAVAGSTALEASVFEAQGIVQPATRYSLETQMNWFRHLLDLLMSSSSSSSEEVLSNSLFLVGEIGGNDIQYLLNKNRDMNQTRRYVPLVVSRISWLITALIELGATTFVVPGNIPIGCTPSFLTVFHGETVEDYDPETGCLKPLNEFAEYQDYVLQLELDRIRKLHPHVIISYADYYNSSMSIIRNPQLFGFKAPVTSACCGVSGPYNFSWSAICDHKMTSVCSDPSASFSWDGIHLTESAYRFISQSLLTGESAHPSFTGTCPNMWHSAA